MARAMGYIEGAEEDFVLNQSRGRRRNSVEDRRGEAFCFDDCQLRGGEGLVEVGRDALSGEVIVFPAGPSVAVQR